MMYARIEDGKVAELFETNEDITEMFHPDLNWVQAPDDVGVQCGWSYVDGSFLPDSSLQLVNR